MSTIPDTLFRPHLVTIRIRLNEFKDRALRDRNEFGLYEYEDINPFSPITNNESLENLEDFMDQCSFDHYKTRSNKLLLRNLPWRVYISAKLCNFYSQTPATFDKAMDRLIDAYQLIAIIDHTRMRGEIASTKKKGPGRVAVENVIRSKSFFLRELKKQRLASDRETIKTVLQRMSVSFLTKNRKLTEHASLDEHNFYESIISWRNRDYYFRKNMDFVIDDLSKMYRESRTLNQD